MKKQLNIDRITNELEGASLFFTKSTTSLPAPEPEKPSAEKSEQPTPLVVESAVQMQPEKVKKEKTKGVMVSRHHDTTPPRYHVATTPQIENTAIELIRKAVKEFGKEAATHRFTEAEKKEIADLIYTYKNRGVKTSENEITRIAVNFIIEDYKENGESSVLHKILKALKE